MTQICTIAARNYLAHVRVLARSFLRHHPEGSCSVFLIDDPDGLEANDDEPFTQVTLSQIGIAEDEYLRMATIYDVTELATAVKPWVLRAAINGGHPAAFLDPDIEFHAAIDEVNGLANREGIVLTPHTLHPMKRDGLLPSEMEILRAGIYNLGFIVVGASGAAFLDWWAERLARDCIVDPGAGLHVDQRWVDFAPGYFNTYILRDPGYNVAYWNVDQRQLAWTGSRYEAGGAPLRFYHFSGFDPRTPHVLSKHQIGSPRLEVAANPGLTRLCSRYGEALTESGFNECIGGTYRFGRAANGMALDTTMRRLYRSALLKDESVPPPPFSESAAEQFVAWLQAPATGEHSGSSRYWRARLEAGPDVLRGTGLSGPAFEEWARGEAAEGRLPNELLPSSSQTVPNITRRRPRGVNLAGYLRAESGVGEYARLVGRVLADAGEHVAHVPYERTVLRQEASFGADAATPQYDVNLVGVNADEFPNFVHDVGRDFFDGRYTIGLWSWEVEEFPNSMASSSRFVDEVWAISSFGAAAIAAAIDKPVRALAPPIIPVDLPATSRPKVEEHDGVPLFLFCFDFHSVLARKNPQGLIDAFRRAFPKSGSARLVIKTVNGHHFPEKLSLLESLAAGRDDIEIRNGYMAPLEQQCLMASCDAYVSLHRSEGFGLTLAEAMALGKPVIATGYSGNLDFMSEQNSLLVPFDLVEIGPEAEPYPAHAQWASPDLDAAAEMLRGVAADPGAAARRAAQTRIDVLRDHGTEARAEVARIRLREIRSGLEVHVAANGNDISRVTRAHAVEPGVGPLLALARRQPLRPRHARYPVRAARAMARRVVARTGTSVVEAQDARIASFDRASRARDAVAQFQTTEWLAVLQQSYTRLAANVQRTAELTKAALEGGRMALAIARQTDERSSRGTTASRDLFESTLELVEPSLFVVDGPHGPERVGFGPGGVSGRPRGSRSPVAGDGTTNERRLWFWVDLETRTTDRAIADAVVRRNALTVAGWAKVEAERQQEADLVSGAERFHSQHGEDGILSEIFRRCGEGNRSFVEFGSGTGEENCTRNLAERGWRGLWLDADADAVAECRSVAPSGVSVAHELLTVENLVASLQQHGAADELDLCVIDVDGNDYWLWAELTKQYRPRVVVVEYNGLFPPGVDWIMPYEPDFAWDGTYWQGASLTSMEQLGTRMGYRLVCCDPSGVNAFFVRDDVAAEAFSVESGDATRHYCVPKHDPSTLGHPKRIESVQGPRQARPEELRLITLDGAEVLSPEPVLAGSTVVVLLEIRNGTDLTLASAGMNPFQVAATWVPDDDSESQLQPRTRLPWAIPPSEARLVALSAEAPTTPGTYVLELALVQEFVGWTGRSNPAGRLRLPLKVSPRAL